MDYQFAIDPSLGISTEDFVITWNSNIETYQHSKAMIQETTPKTLEAGLATVVVSFVAGSIASGLIYDLAKGATLKLFTQKNISKEVTVEKHNGPDGSEIIVIKEVINKNT